MYTAKKDSLHPIRMNSYVGWRGPLKLLPITESAACVRSRLIKRPPEGCTVCFPGSSHSWAYGYIQSRTGRPEGRHAAEAVVASKNSDPAGKVRDALVGAFRGRRGGGKSGVGNSDFPRSGELMLQGWPVNKLGLCMIQIEETEAGDYQMRQTLYEPVVYLDHWAVRNFSTDKALRDRFITALHRSGGTLLVSLHNFGEFSGVNVEEHAIAAEKFFDLALPRMFVADFGADPGFIQLRGRPTADGKQENLILMEMAKRWLENGHQLSMAGLVNESEENRAIVGRALKDLQVGITKIVNSLKADPKKVEVARANKKPPGATLRDLVQDAFLRDFVINEQAVFGEHDASDFVHALGAVMASDFVLLDGRWAHIVNQADKQLKKKGVTHRLPKAFPERQVPQFLDALEAYPVAAKERKAKTISR